MRRPRGAVIALVGVAAAAALVLAWVGGKPHPAADREIAAFIGDSYTQGAGASSETRKGFVFPVARSQGWEFRNLGRGSTGYLRSIEDGKNACGLKFCPNYDQIIVEAKKLRPTIVVVSGGRNDVGLAPGSEHQAINRFFADLHAQLPKAHVFVMSPLWASTAAPEQLNQIAEWVRAAAHRSGARYLNLGQPLVGDRDLVSADGVHPNDAGYAVIAKLTMAAIHRAPSW